MVSEDGAWAVVPVPHPLKDLKSLVLDAVASPLHEAPVRNRTRPLHRHMDPYTLAYLAGHSDFAMTQRYVHPQKETVRKAMEMAPGGHASGHATSKTAPGDAPEAVLN